VRSDLISLARIEISFPKCTINVTSRVLLMTVWYIIVLSSAPISLVRLLS